MPGDIARRRDRNEGNVTIWDAEIGFLNFAGAPSKFLPQGGKRTFSVFFEADQARDLERQGWNIKWPKVRPNNEEEDYRKPHLSVEVKFGKKPPRLVLVTTRGRVGIPEDKVDIFDWVDMAKVDLIIRPYDYDFDLGKGRKAYLKSLFVFQEIDELERAYAHIPEVNAPFETLEIEARSDDDDEDVVDGDVVHVQSHRELGR